MSSILPQPSPSGARVTGGPVVLIVEDEALIAFNLEDAFGEEGFVVTGPFSSCADALASLAAGLPDVAVLDAVLKDGPCLELARELRRRGVPFVIYSGRDALDDRPPELEGIAWIEKPAAVETVIRAVGRLITARTAPGP